MLTLDTANHRWAGLVQYESSGRAAQICLFSRYTPKSFHPEHPRPDSLSGVLMEWQWRWLEAGQASPDQPDCRLEGDASLVDLR